MFELEIRTRLRSNNLAGKDFIYPNKRVKHYSAWIWSACLVFKAQLSPQYVSISVSLSVFVFSIPVKFL